MPKNTLQDVQSFRFDHEFLTKKPLKWLSFELTDWQHCMRRCFEMCQQLMHFKEKNELKGYAKMICTFFASSSCMRAV